MFSRANILLLWSGTKDDLVSLGAKFFYKEMHTHGHPLHLGTREIQLCLLKTALMLGVEVCYETSMVGFLFDKKSDMWCAQLKGTEEIKREAGEAEGLKKALEFKPLKTGDYETTFKCNMVDNPEVDPNFVSMRVEGSTLKPFHACVIAEGEWSQSCRALGFEKMIDRFKQALGIVVNLDYDKTNKTEARMKSFTNSYFMGKIELLQALSKSGIDCENIEYLKGRTHYLALTINKGCLLSSGVLKKDLPADSLLTVSKVIFTLHLHK